MITKLYFSASSYIFYSILPVLCFLPCGVLITEEPVSYFIPSYFFHIIFTLYSISLSSTYCSFIIRESSFSLFFLTDPNSLGLIFSTENMSQREVQCWWFLDNATVVDADLQHLFSKFFTLQDEVGTAQCNTTFKVARIFDTQNYLVWV